MAKRSDITPELCRQLLRYEPETGKLFWLPRPLHMFTTQRSCSTWNGRFAGKEAFTNSTSKGHKKGWIFNIAFYAHRVAWAIYYGSWPKDQIDHVNGSPNDNRIRNLREVTHSENLRNCGLDARNTSGVNGVSWNKRKGCWQAYVCHNGKRIHLGSFTDRDVAADARREADLKYGYFPGHGLSRPATATVT